MSYGRAVIYAAFVGTFVPCLFMAIRSIFAIAIGGYIDEVQLALWPTSIWLIAAAAGGRLSLELHALSVLANALLYSVLGFLLWVGFTKSTWLLFAIGILILVAWATMLGH